MTNSNVPDDPQSISDAVDNGQIPPPAIDVNDDIIQKSDDPNRDTIKWDGSKDKRLK